MAPSKWEDSSLHGPPLVVKSGSKFGKSFWIAIIILSVALFAYQAFKILNQYFANDVAVEIKTYAPTMWPNVYFCPQKWINPKKLIEMGIVREGREGENQMKCLLLGSIPTMSNLQQLYFKTKCSQHIGRWPEISENASKADWGKLDVLDLFTRISYSHNDLFYQQPEYYIKKFVNFKGVCFVIKFNETAMPFVLFGEAKKPMIYMKPDIASIFDDVDNQTLQMTDELFIFDSNETLEFLEMPKIKTYESPLILMKKEEYIRQSSSKTHCKSTTGMQKMKDMVECFDEICVEKSMDISMVVGYNNGTPKTITEYANYLNPAKHCHQQIMLKNPDLLQSCFKEQPNTCKSVSFSFISYPTNDPVFIWGPNRTVPVISLGFQTSWSRQVVTEFSLYSWDTLLCNLGGMLSLFSGASMLSLIQLMILMIPKRAAVDTPPAQ